MTILHKEKLNCFLTELLEVMELFLIIQHYQVEIKLTFIIITKCLKF